MSLSPGLQLFNDLVHNLNSTLDLENVMAQVIDQVNDFLHIDATSVSLLDPESEELVIRMTVGQATDPRPGLRLPPFAGIAGWVAHHGEAVLIPDAQQDKRFYPAVDQLTGFTTRSVLCVPMRIKDRTIGVIQAINSRADIFSYADLCFMETLADVAAFAVENARLFTSEQRLRRQAEKLELISETISASLQRELALDVALQYLHEIVSCDSATIFVRQEVPVFERDSAEHTGLRLRKAEYLRAITVWGFQDPSAILNMCEPVDSVPLFEQMCVYKRPIVVADIQLDDRYVQLAGTEPVRSWMGVPMIVEGEVVGQVTLDRHRVDEFTHRDINAAVMFAQQAAVAVTNAQLYREARDRADELSILNEIAMAATASMDIDVLAGRALDALLALFDLHGAGIALLDESGGKLSLRAQRSLAPHLVRAVECESVEKSEVCCGVIRQGCTMLLTAPPEDAKPDVDTGALVPLLAPNTALGLLVLQGGELNTPSSRQLALLEAIGRQIGIAVDRARLYEGARQKRGE